MKKMGERRGFQIAKSAISVEKNKKKMSVRYRVQCSID